LPSIAASRRDDGGLPAGTDICQHLIFGILELKIYGVGEDDIQCRILEKQSWKASELA